MLLWALSIIGQTFSTYITVRTPGVRWADRLGAFCPSVAYSVLMFLTSGIVVHARRTGKHSGDILQQLNPAVEGSAGNHIERDVGIAVVDAFRAGGTGDHGEHHDPEAIDDPGAQQRAGQADAAERAEDAGALLLHRPDRLHGVAAHEGRVGPREGLLERGREHHLRRSRELVDAGLLLGLHLGGSRRRLSAGEAGHQPVRVRAHQVRHRWLLAEPGEVLRPFETPPAGPAIPRRVAVQGGDEVDQELSHGSSFLSYLGFGDHYITEIALFHHPA